MKMRTTRMTKKMMKQRVAATTTEVGTIVPFSRRHSKRRLPLIPSWAPEGANCPAKQTLFESSTRDIFVGGDPRDWTYAEVSVLENAVVKTHNSLTYICTTGTTIIRYLWDAYAWQ
mmetsp:Transcript_49754/g.55465  ORF Transcript_49754/g.55465 Transcript_49754/m.55465 type:complete len:116 (-) Transcript_49754:198-545(-)